jgi:hypothetical protein
VFELIVTAPVDPEIVTFVPATRLVTPVLVNVTAPVAPDAERPAPDVAIDETPLLILDSRLLISNGTDHVFAPADVI